MNILLVEDNIMAAMAAEELLINKFNCQVDIAKTGKDAIRLAKKNNYKLILMDIGLPDISGFETSRQIKNHNNSLNRDTTIIGLTASSGFDTKASGLDAGMTEILEKPLNREKMLELFEKINNSP